MNRRRFLQFLSAAPAAAALPSLAAALPVVGVDLAAGPDMTAILLAQAEKIVNPPLIIYGGARGGGKVETLFATRYREEFVAVFQEHLARGKR